MDFGTVMEIDGLVSASSAFSSADMDSIRQRGLYRSALLKHARPGEIEENDWMCLKAPRNSEVSLMAPTKSSSSSLISPSSHSLFPDGQQMLSFSSPKQDSLMLCNDGGLAYYQPSASSFPLSSSSYPRNAGLRGPFTPSQWMELEHQALIYKYIDANVPVPSSLLIAIRKSLGSSGFPSYSPASLRTTELGWNPFQLGFSGNADPEPGRCRRTDGKKWRCSRDAVADQKYCERHMNRGRHRSRKPVEGHSGHAAKPVSLISPSIQPSNNNKPTSPSIPPFSSRIAMNKETGNGEDGLFSAPQPNPLRHFFDDWPKNPSNRSVISWPEVEDVQSERTQLSISIPMASSEFSSSSCSPNQERTARTLPSKLSREADPTHMGLGVGQRETSWIPVSWESSMGGPLGEVLNKPASNPNAAHSKNPNSSLNLMADAWERASPTGVLQKSTAFASLSSSAGSSPRADATRGAHDSTGSLCDNLLVNSTSIPTL